MTANYEQPDVMNKRVRFYDGQFLQDQDFVDEQKYNLDRRQRLTRWLHVAGIANGLEVRTGTQPFQVRVAAGTAIDPHGRLLVLATMKTILDSDGKALLVDASEPVILPASAANSDRWLYIAYHQMPDDLQASGDGVEGETRWHEAPFLFATPALLGEDDTYDGPSWVDFLASGPPPPVLLARLTLSTDGAVTIDSNVRRYSGLRLPGLRSGHQAATLRVENDGRIGLWSLKDGDLIEHLSLIEKGFLGLGTPAPTAALDIRTELKATVQNRSLIGLRIAPTFNANNLTGVRQYGLLVEGGSVGIGTGTPAAALEVVGGGGNSVDLIVNGRLRSNNNDGGLWVAADRFVGGHSTNKAGFYNNGSWRLTVQSDGKVGIGTLTPSVLLDVAGSIRSFDGTVRAGNDTNNYTEIGHGGSHGYVNMVGVGRLELRHEGSTVLSLKDDGNVGIGNNDPGQRLLVESSHNASKHNDNQMTYGGTLAIRSNAPQIDFIDTNNNDWAIHVNSNKMYFVRQPWESTDLVLDGGGKVGIGTDKPDMKLTITSSARHLQLRRESSETIGDKQLFLELYQDDSSDRRVPETYPSIRFHHSNRYWHRIEARSNGIHFKEGNLNDDGYVTVHTGALMVNNSDIYFTKTDHNHTGFGNTKGYAAIENAANHNALMILGRTDTDNKRIVKLWDYLQVNGTLEVTSEIRGKVWYSQEYEWSQGDSPVKMGHSSKCVAFLTYVRGKFEGGGEYVQVYVGSDGYWYLGGASAQSSVRARARCIGTP